MCYWFGLQQNNKNGTCRLSVQVVNETSDAEMTSLNGTAKGFCNFSLYKLISQ
jgi:hypothetical protein